MVMKEMWISHWLLVPLNVKVDPSNLTLSPYDISVLNQEGGGSPHDTALNFLMSPLML